MDKHVAKGITQLAIGAGGCLAGLALLYVTNDMPPGEPSMDSFRTLSSILMLVGLVLMIKA